jgi:dienelactone hydrolase
MRRALLVFLCVAAVADAKASAEAKLLAKLGRVWFDCATALKATGFKEEAERFLARAREADPAAKGLEKLGEEIEALPAGGELNVAAKKRIAKANKDAAKVYDRLAKLDHEPEEAIRFESYLFSAIEIDPSRSRIGRVLALVKKNAGNQAKTPVAGRLLARLREVDPKGTTKYDALETSMASKDLALIKGKDHPLLGYLSLPKGWKKGGSYPVLVAVEGAGCNFLGAARGFAKSRGSRKYIVLTPCGFSNTNQLLPKKYPFYPPKLLEENNGNRIGFDLEGLDALLAAARERYGAEEKIGITGFSGGGNLCYAMTIGRPGRILFSAPACANFGGQGLSDAKPVEDGGPPIHILTGANDQHRDFTFGKKDSPGIEPQTDNAVKLLERLNFTNFKRTLLPGVGHSACRRQVWEFADQVAGKGR